jgi:predicted transposase
MFVSLQFKLELKKEDKEKLIKLMRKQSSAIRTAYNMLKEFEKEKTKKPHAQTDGYTLELPQEIESLWTPKC